MSFFIYDISFLVAFCLFLIIFLSLKKKNIKREGILILYRTKLGLEAINYISKKYKNFLNKFESVVIFFGYVLMAGGIFLIGQIVWIFIQFPDFIRAIKIPPIVPLIPYLPTIFKADYLPPFYFTYWIIVLAITAVFHEFLHGIFAKARDIKIKSTGFAFLGPFAGAFVEPDEEKVKKLKIMPQIAFLSAGSFANLILTIVFLFVLWGFFALAFSPSGAIFNTYTYNIINSTSMNISNESLFINFDGGLNLTKISAYGKSYYVLNNLVNASGLVPVFEDSPALRAGLAGIVVEMDGNRIRNQQDLANIINKKKPGEAIEIKTLINSSIKEYNIILSERPDAKGKAYLGIGFISTSSSSIMGKIRNVIVFFKDPNTYYLPRGNADLMTFIYNLIWWILLVNFSVALFNMLPLGIFDGGRVFYLTILGIFRSKQAAEIAFKISTWIFIAAFVALTLMWVLTL